MSRPVGPGAGVRAGRRPSPRALAGAVLAVVLLTAAACSSSSTGGPSNAGGPGDTAPIGGTAPPGTAVTAVADLAPAPLHVVAGERPHLADAQGREVLLRGVNVNSFGEYFQADPDLPSTVPVTDEDWASMASLGFSAVRFIVSWSKIEPTRGQYDEAYVAQVRDGVRAAGRHGINVIVDMHQDAWGPYVSTPEGTACEDGSEPAIGWDGAPKWATAQATAEDTCRIKGARELSRVVGNSFTAFYADTDGLRASLVAVWGHLAGALATEPAVVGYDLFNEPNAVGDGPTTLANYTAFLTDSITAIRAAEDKAGAEPRIVFVEPIVTWPLPNTAPAAGFTTDPNVGFAPHNYFGSISKLLTPEQGFAANTAKAEELGAPLWIGEYGWWDDNAEDMAMLRRYAKAEDEAITGSAWWQWRQACGDPHTLDNPERKTSDQLHLNGVGCPGDRDKGVTEAYAKVLSRAYPRFAPGTITQLVSDPDARTMTIAATGATPGGKLVVWVPDAGKGEPQLYGQGVDGIETTQVDGGWIVTGAVKCGYRLDVDGPDTTTRPPVPAC